ncbi:LytR/AlgR family response regulator transcription factor [Bacteroides nordii]|uniref:LytR/AlgR family response regulator transcription factor n=1 Tax=Bacteroides nordii TaxID=291645 RepID=UPI00189F4D1E|nr:LytTR family DNA-binding domain-containing protein [Bacteroides nordii]
MKYVVLKNTHNVLCVQLPEGFGTNLEIVCFENQTEFDSFLKETPTGVCQIGFPQPSAGTIEEQGCFPHDGFFIRQNDFFKKILFCEIMWVEASRSYCYIHTTKQNKLIVTCPMAEVKKKLPPELFIQIHRSYIINKKCVNKYIGNMVYIDKQSFPVSRKFKPMVLDQFLFLENPKDKPENDFQRNTEEERTD